MGADTTTARWTDADILLAHQTGRDYERARLAEVADDLATTTLRPPDIPYEQRVTDRLGLMLRSAAPHEYRGGPVDYNQPRPLAGWLVETGQQACAHDRAALEVGRNTPPAYTTWAQVHAQVDERVWWRIFHDLNPATRAQLAASGHAPAQAVLGGEAA